MPEEKESTKLAYDPAAVDAAAEEALKDLENLEEATVKSMAGWWAKWYMRAGHKRLGRILAQIAKG